jgi:hypothetical protein
MLRVPFSIVDGKVRGVSTCGLVAEGFWRMAGIKMSSLHEPYRFGTAIARALNFAIKHDAYHLGHRGIKYGDYVLFRGGKHVATVTDADDTHIYTVDGGQVCGVKRLQCIKERKRLRKEVTGFIDVSRLPYEKKYY